MRLAWPDMSIPGEYDILSVHSSITATSAQYVNLVKLKQKHTVTGDHGMWLQLDSAVQCLYLRLSTQAGSWTEQGRR